MAFRKGGKGKGKGWWGKGKGKGDKGDGKGKGKDGKGKGIEKGKGKGIQGNCWGCGKKGHRQSECRTNPAVAAVEDGTDEDHGWEDEDFNDVWGVLSLTRAHQ